jgi:hypothetical protein
MATVVFDIETVGGSWDSLDDGQRTYLQKYVRNDEERAKLPEMMSLWPLTGKIVVLAMLNPDTGRGRVWYEKGDGRFEETSADGLFTFVGDTEPAFLAEFWGAIVRFDRFVSFNGRCFDGPFLMLRSAALGLRVSKNLAATATPSSRTPTFSTCCPSSARPGSGTSTSRARPSASKAPRKTAWTDTPSGTTTGKIGSERLRSIAGATSRRPRGSSRSSRKPSFRRWKTRDSEAGARFSAILFGPISFRRLP